ncbi:MAG: tRNA (N(6)-L-threonylcarbamoyladenosine(37)-C(2))-methylthiotransferase MtaB [Chitinophagaceae bacterium]|nr:tRNA (N(6)-L-threonylcarbamoyladenosine(37)-C(2))-methylthiotransferase MtaB [Chitinophagaceae bacterium]
MKEQQRIAYHTLGCKLNFSETSTIARSFEEEGYTKTDFNQEADVYVINTCSVTENADKECKQLIRRVKKQNPLSTVVITGCYAQLKPERIATISGVDLVIGASEKFNVAKHVAEFKRTGEAKICSCDIEDVQGFHSSFSLHDRTRTFLKVQDGCDYSCTFCTIPLARGHSRSDTIQGVLDNVNELANTGVQEIVLTGVNLGDFGKGYNGARSGEEHFFDLIKALDEKSSVPRFRISSIEPNLLTNDIIEFVAISKRFMPHFHIPLQSGSNALLGQMKRRYKRELYTERVEKIKSLMPHCCIGVDVIVGFPGETDEEFQATYDYLHQLDVSYLHVFTYSERENTAAITMNGVVPVSIRKERNAMLRNLSEKKMNYFTEQQRGNIRPVLFEHAEKNGLMEGYSDNYIRVSMPYNENAINSIMPYTL